MVVALVTEDVWMLQAYIIARYEATFQAAAERAMPLFALLKQRIASAMIIHAVLLSLANGANVNPRVRLSPVIFPSHLGPAKAILAFRPFNIKHIMDGK